jgi:hypothetical protein
MRTTFRSTIVATLTFVLLGMVCVSNAAAQCGSFNPSDKEAVGQAQLINASFLLVDHQRDPIVGFWKAKFTSEGSTGIPDGAVVDSPFVQWHSDNTEIMNSTRVPATQSFCLGVWQRTGHSTYSLNHFALSFDTDGKTFIGPTQIRESVTLSDDHNSYNGAFTIDQFDPTGTLLVEVKGSVVAIRVTVDTNIDQVL